MRIHFISTLLTFCLFVKGQIIEYRNDSLFIENVYVDAQTPKNQLDKILGESGRTINSKSDFRRHPATGKKVKETTIYYLNHGLYFRKYDYDSTKLSIGVKLYQYKISKDEANYGMSGRPFTGQLFIAENLINGKRSFSELQKMKNCTLTVDEAVIGSYKRIIGGDIVYKENIIRLSFDNQTNELTEVVIHHNFKDR